MPSHKRKKTPRKICRSEENIVSEVKSPSADMQLQDVIQNVVLEDTMTDIVEDEAEPVAGPSAIRSDAREQENDVIFVEEEVQPTHHVQQILDNLEAEFQDLAEKDRDPDYVPEIPEKTRKSERLESKERLLYTKKYKPRDPEKIQVENEKKAFYNAVRKFGSKDAASIHSCLPDRTLQSVKEWINREKHKHLYKLEQRAVRENGSYEVLDELKKSRNYAPQLHQKTEIKKIPDADWRENCRLEEVMTKVDTHSATDKWIDNINQVREKHNKKREKRGLEKAPACESMIPKCLRWIAEFEKHPDPSKCGGIDYAAIYRYFSLLAEGEIPPDLDPASALRVTRLLSDISTLVAGSMSQNETDFLQNYAGPFTRYNTSSGYNEKSKSSKQLAELCLRPGINPLNFNLDFCVDKKLDLSKMCMVVKPGASSQTSDTIQIIDQS